MATREEFCFDDFLSHFKELTSLNLHNETSLCIIKDVCYRIVDMNAIMYELTAVGHFIQVADLGTEHLDINQKVKGNFKTLIIFIKLKI